MESGDRNRSSDRKRWIESLLRVVSPVLEAGRNRELRLKLPVTPGTEGRAVYACLEALGRTIAGIAPWLASPAGAAEEERLKSSLAESARCAIASAVDRASPDRMNFAEGPQPLVDAAFLAQGLLRAPAELLAGLTEEARTNLRRAFESTRAILPYRNNWLLFSAVIECALSRMGGSGDRMRIDYALREHMSWYKGDGAYGDGPEFHWDYYNSFVIHPMLIDILETAGSMRQEWMEMRSVVLNRAQRYAEVLERMISPDGGYPPIGRSLAYRCGAFQLLAQMALRRELPPTLSPQQVRCALTAVIEKTLDAPGTFDEEGWLAIGVHGRQPEIAERYISTGSLYLCTTAFLPLGLPETDPFWQGSGDWTQKRLWSGGAVAADHALTSPS